LCENSIIILYFTLQERRIAFKIREEKNYNISKRFPYYNTFGILRQYLQYYWLMWVHKL